MQYKENAETLMAVYIYIYIYIYISIHLQTSGIRLLDRESYSLYTTKKLFVQKILSTNQTKINSTYTELNSQIGFICVAQNTVNKIGYMLKTSKLVLSF